MERHWSLIDTSCPGKSFTMEKVCRLAFRCFLTLCGLFLFFSKLRLDPQEIPSKNKKACTKCNAGVRTLILLESLYRKCFQICVQWRCGTKSFVSLHNKLDFPLGMLSPSSWAKACYISVMHCVPFPELRKDCAFVLLLIMSILFPYFFLKLGCV